MKTNNFLFRILNNSKYNKGTRLKQAHYIFLFLFYLEEPDIRSTDIVFFFKQYYSITISRRWVNALLFKKIVIELVAGLPKVIMKNVDLV